MKIKLLFLVTLLATGGSLFAQEGTPVRSITGSGAPGGSVATKVGTQYIDISANPPALYVCSSISIAANGTVTCNWTAAGGGGITSVSSLPATCTAGTSQPVQLTGPLVINGISFGASTVFYCDSTNHYSPVSQGSGAAPIVGWYLSNACPPSNQAQCFNTPANTQVDQTCSWTAASTLVTCTDGPFTAADASPTNSKQAWGYSSNASFSGNAGCNPFQLQPVAAFMTATHLTVASFVSATQINLNANPTNASVNATSCFIWGTPDDTGATALETAYDAATSCPKVTLAAGYYLFTTPHFSSQPTACANLPEIFPGSGPTQFGNVWFSIGMELEGRGTGPTKIWHPPDFPQSGACNKGQSGVSCYAVPTEGYFHDFAMSSGSGRGGMPANTNLMEVSVGTLAYFTCTTIGGEVNGTAGVRINAQAQLFQVNLSACAKVGLLVSSNTGNVLGGITYNWPAANAYRLSVDNSMAPGIANVQLQNGSRFGCHNCQTFGTQDAVTGIAQWLNQGGKLWLEDVGMFGENSTTPTTAYACQANAGCELHANHVIFSAPSISSTPANGIQCSVACSNWLADSYVNSVGAGTGFYSDVAGSKLISLGGNIYIGAATVSATSLLALAPTDNLGGVTSGVTGTCTFTSGGGTSPSCALQSGSTNEKGVIIATTGTGAPGTTGTINLNFVGTYTVSTLTPQCNFNIDNSGTVWGNEAGLQTNTQSTTTPQLAWFNLVSGTLTALTVSSPYRIGYTCILR